MNGSRTSDNAILRGRHCRHYAAMAEASWEGRVGPDDLPWQDWLVDELDNLRVAWAWAWATGDHTRVVSIPANLVTYAGSFPAEVWSWAEQAARATGRRAPTVRESPLPTHRVGEELHR